MKPTLTTTLTVTQTLTPQQNPIFKTVANAFTTNWNKK